MRCCPLFVGLNGLGAFCTRIHIGTWVSDTILYYTYVLHSTYFPTYVRRICILSPSFSSIYPLSPPPPLPDQTHRNKPPHPWMHLTCLLQPSPTLPMDPCIHASHVPLCTQTRAKQGQKQTCVSKAARMAASRLHAIVRLALAMSVCISESASQSAGWLVGWLVACCSVS